MISIVAHGIFGTSYRQDAFVEEGVRDNGNLRVLHDIRRLLSTQYDDGTPLGGWAIQPAPTGMWLNRIERAFDSDYVSAYVMFSFFIPRGKILNPDSLQRIERRLVENREKFVRQGIILYDPDWNFLLDLSRELEDDMKDDCSVNPTRSYRPSKRGAFCDDDVPSIMINLWDERFSQFGIVFCGNRILAQGADITPIGDASSIKVEVPTTEMSADGGSSKKISNPITRTHARHRYLLLLAVFLASIVAVFFVLFPMIKKDLANNKEKGMNFESLIIDKLDSSDITIEEVISFETSYNEKYEINKRDRKIINRIYALKHLLLMGLMPEVHSRDNLINIFMVHSDSYSRCQQRIIEWYLSLDVSQQLEWNECDRVYTLSEFKEKLQNKIR